MADESESIGDAREQVRTAFPAVDRIDDDGLREGVLRAWETALVENGIEDLEAVPWLPPVQAELGLHGETLVPHVTDVVAGALALAESLRETHPAELDLSLDRVRAGALVHDVSKPYEYDGAAETVIGDLLGHPHYGVHVAAAAGLPTEIQHVVLAHSPRSAVEPATLEATLVTQADRAAVAAIRSRAPADE